MSVTFKFKKHVSVVCNLSIGEEVTVSGWGYALDNKKLIIEDIRLQLGGCESSVMVKVDKYDSYIDSNWIDNKELVNS